MLGMHAVEHCSKKMVIYLMGTVEYPLRIACLKDDDMTILIFASASNPDLIVFPMKRSISVQFVFSVLNFDNQYVFTYTLKPVNMSTAQGKKKIAHTTDVSTCILVTLMV